MLQVRAQGHGRRCPLSLLLPLGRPKMPGGEGRGVRARCSAVIHHTGASGRYVQLRMVCPLSPLAHLCTHTYCVPTCGDMAHSKHCTCYY